MRHACPDHIASPPITPTERTAAQVPNSEGQIDVETDVVITLAAVVVPSPPNTSSVAVRPSGEARDVPAMLLILVLAMALVVVARPRASVG